MSQLNFHWPRSTFSNMKMHRSLVAICLALMLVLTGQSMAVARGSAPAVGHMVLCVGTSSVVVYMDETGAPTAAPHVCPDCTLTLFVTEAEAPLIFAVRLSRWVPETPPAPAIYVKPRLLSYLSRAPPALI